MPVPIYPIGGHPGPIGDVEGDGLVQLDPGTPGSLFFPLDIAGSDFLYGRLGRHHLHGPLFGCVQGVLHRGEMPFRIVEETEVGEGQAVE